MKNNQNTTLLVLGIVMFVNALSYGTIVPLLYPYAARYGLSPFGLSMLFAAFSIAQFIATPIIGRLSDRYGRKPTLLLCLLGTSVSLALFALARNVPMLFIARILDGITGGNNSVAQAVVADSTTGADRAKGFGVLGAAFGFGFLLGPAIGGIIGQFGLSAPFWFAAALALIGTVIGQVVLKETLPEANKKIVTHEPLFNFKAIAAALFSPISGLVLGISFIAAVGLNSFIFGFQTVSNDTLRMSVTEVGILLSVFGLVGVVMQMFGIRVLLSKVTSKKRIIMASFVASAVMLVVTSFARTPITFGAALILFAIFSSPQMPVITALLSERTRPEDQGALLGINQSYMSLGQIGGPLLAGLVATWFGAPMAFVLAAAIYGIGVLVSYGLYRPVKAKVNI